MKKFLVATVVTLMLFSAFGQNVMTPELLWKLGRVSAIGMTKDGQNIVYRVTIPSVEENKFNSKFYTISVNGGEAKTVENASELVDNPLISPNGKYILYDKPVAIEKVLGKDIHEDLPQTSVSVFNGLNYRHWDTWNDGSFNHVFFKEIGSKDDGVDIMENEPFNCPQKPFGGSEDYCWSPEGSAIVYVSKKLSGAEYASRTNSDIYIYHVVSGRTENLTENNPGYDTHPSFSPKGDLAWLQMKRDGYEADKNDIIVKSGKLTMNLTQFWDGTVSSFVWNETGEKIYFTAPIDGTNQLFEVNFPGNSNRTAEVKQLTKGDFDVTSIVGFSDTKAILTRTDMNHAAEIYSYDLKKKVWKKLTTVNDEVYSKIKMSQVKAEYFETTDGEQMLTWVIYPPNFDPTKKYPTLLYCQGGPQSALSQFYSFRWNFQLMAAQGYIIVAPNRRGMPGYGEKWNEQISKDWGGQVMDDYLTAIDEMAKKPFVDETRLGAIGASYGGYSVFYLAGMHENRFKTFISHCGVFNTESMYGTTEEVFFVNWDLGGPYWDYDNPTAQKGFNEFNPKNMVQNWDTPILIIQGGKDYRVPIGQGQEAFQAAQLKGIKSRFVYFPDENHWILKPQNAIAWQREFFGWLKETL